jgi:hypothetical protein
MKGYLRPAIAGIAILAFAGAISAVSVLRSDGSGATARSDTQQALPPLPPGPPRKTTAEATSERVTMDDMISRAPMVFLGRVSAIGGSEVVSPTSAEEGPALTVHRTRFEVLRSLRGDLPAVIDISEFDVLGAAAFEIGGTYVVFAESRSLGSSKTAAVVPFGYAQGVYRQTAADLVRNDINGSIGITRLVERLKERG